MRFPFFRKKETGPVIRKRAEHTISRKNIAPEALSVLYRLSDAGFISYLVGGSVRDMLLGRQPKDFDVATDAYPRQIKKLFRNAFLIGRRFRLALICFKDRQIETSTFRREPDETEAEDDGRPGALYRSEDNLFGTPEQDAQRRDFTVNGLFYDIKTFDVIDYVGGLEDLERHILRSIGDPNVRFREDPVRMMRAVRFATKLGFDIHRDSEKAILRHHAEIGNASPPRLFEEILRLFTVGAAPAFRLLNDLKLMGDLLPAVAAHVKASGGRRSPLWGLLEAFDAHAEDPLHDDHGLCFATLLHPLFADRLRAAAKAGDQPAPETIAAELVGDALVNPFAARTWAPPRSVCEAVANILAAQARLDADDPQIRRPRMISRDWFPAAALLWRIRTEASGGDLGRVAELEKAVRKGNRTARAMHADFEEGRRPKSERPQPEVKGPKSDNSKGRKSGRGRSPGSPKPQPSETQTPKTQTPKNPAEAAPETPAVQGSESEAGQGDAPAEQGAAPRRRHRRRGGRRHHRGGGNAEQAIGGT